MAHTIPDIHTSYQEEGGELSYRDFKAACAEFNMQTMDEILAGKEIPMGYNLASLSIIRVERNYQRLQINWNASLELRDEILEEEGVTEEELCSKENPDGIEWYVYYTDPWFARFYWQKSRCRVPNKSVYSFTATRGEKGNKTKLKRLLREDDMAYTNFKLHKNIYNRED